MLLIGGAAAIWPLGARAQQPAMPVAGFLDIGSAAERTQQVAAFRKGLTEGGYQEEQDVALEFRWAEGQYARFAELAADLVRRGVSVIAIPGSGTGAKAIRAKLLLQPQQHWCRIKCICNYKGCSALRVHQNRLFRGRSIST